jgi:glycosyltransferase involved in cell wall biosynthesis
MIYLDATSAASSPVNMGVQRTIRALYAHLKVRSPVTPVRWDFSAKCYARVSAREQTFLERPFASYKGAEGTPGLWDWSHQYEGWKDARTRRERGIPHRDLLTNQDLLLIADLSWDSRIHSWPHLAELPGKKVAIFHDAMPLRIPGQADSRDQLFAHYVRALACLDLIICVSREVEEDLHGYWKKFALAPKPTQVIPWPVPFVGMQSENPPNQKARHLLYVSRLRLRKNHLVLLEASEMLWREGENFSLDLIGIEDAFTDTFQILRRMRALAAKGRPVRWRKHISDAELTQAYRDCSFTVFPSRLEGFGLPIIESLWHGRPVICGRNGAIGEVAAGGGCYQVDQNSADELAQAIRLLLADPTVYDRLHEEARARSFRTWEEYGEELDAALQTEAAPTTR